MTKRSSRKAKKKTSPEKKRPSEKKKLPENGAWLPSRGGMIALGVVSLLLAAWITIQGMKVGSFGESVLYGLGFGASIWIVFGLVFVVNKFLRGR